MDSSLLQSTNPALEKHQNYADIRALNDLKQQAREDQRSALKPVAEQFEALFLEQIFKEARKVKLDDGWLDGNQGDFYKDWHDKQLAQNISAKGSLGFADNIVEQLLPSIPNIKTNTTGADLKQEQIQQQPQQKKLSEPPLNTQRVEQETVTESAQAPLLNNIATEHVLAARPLKK